MEFNIIRQNIFTILFSLLSVSAFSQFFSAGGGHCLATCSDGSVRVWGSNSYGQLGLGDEDDRDTILLHPIFNAGVKRAVACADHSLLLKTDGTLWSFGSNGDQGQLGVGNIPDQSTPQLISNFTGVVDMKGGYFSLVLKNDGTIWSFGDAGLYGDTSFPVQVPVVPPIQKIFTSAYTSGAIDVQGSLWMWGENNGGKLGTGDQLKRKVPFKVPGLPPLTSAAIGGNFSMALDAIGNVWSWGANNVGQLGNNNPGNFYVPAVVAGLSNVVKIVASGQSAYALRSDGTVWAWGWNLAGQLGIGNIVDSPVPTQIPGFSGVTDIFSAIDANFYLVKADGSLWACGSASMLGGASNVASNVPLQVPGLCSLFTGSNGMVEPDLSEIFPNPFTGEIFLRGFDGPLSVRVFDVKGRVMLEEFELNQVNSLNLNHLHSGLYLLEIVSHGSRISRRIVKN